jgi:hypothetical protein
MIIKVSGTIDYSHGRLIKGVPIHLPCVQSRLGDTLDACVYIRCHNRLWKALERRCEDTEAVKLLLPTVTSFERVRQARAFSWFCVCSREIWVKWNLRLFFIVGACILLRVLSNYKIKLPLLIFCATEITWRWPHEETETCRDVIVENTK